MAKSYTKWIKGESFIFFYDSYVEARKSWALFRANLNHLRGPLRISTHMLNTGLPIENGPKRNATHGWYFSAGAYDKPEVKKIGDRWALVVPEPVYISEEGR